jgi:hypothetical protein
VYFGLQLGVYRVNKTAGDERFFLCFFKTGIRREKQLGKKFSDCNKTINKKKKR